MIPHWKLKDAPIQQKLMSVILLTCLIVLLLMSTAYLLLEYASYRQIEKSHVSTLGTVIASNSSASLAFDSPSDAAEILNALKAEKNIVAACLYDNRGNLFAKYPDNISSSVFPAKQNSNDYWFEGGYVVGFQQVSQKENPLGTLYLKSSLSGMYVQLRQFAFIAFLLIACSLVVAYLLSTILQKTISEPIIALEATAKAISVDRNYAVRAIRYGKDEIGAFTEAFNQMLTQIETQNIEITSFNQQLEEKIKRRTAQLQDRNLFIETLFDTLEDNVAVFDTECKYVALNKKAEENYKVQEKDVIGKSVSEIFPEVVNSGMLEKLQRAIKGETIHDLSYYSPILKAYLENFYIPLKNVNGQVYNVLLVGHDNSAVLEAAEKIKQANVALEEKNRELVRQKEFVETILDSSDDLIAAYDLELRIIAYNKKCVATYGLSKEEVLGKILYEVFPYLENSKSHVDLKTALLGNVVKNELAKSEKHNFFYQNYIVPLKATNDNVYGAVAIARDITEIVLATEKLKHVNQELLDKNEALSKSNRDLEQFAYVASHDLQEPLRKIQTFAQLLGESFGEEEKLKNYHKKINQAAVRMQNLIQDVLNFSRISKSEEAFVEADLNHILENLKTDFELLLREKEAVITHQVLPVIIGIPLQLSQLFSNLISNSLKYNDKKPAIDISYKNLTNDEVSKHQRLKSGSKYIQIQFADNGIGFDPQFSEQIFGIFQRLHGKQSYSGTGIGLALCKKIVENHNGIIFAESALNKGAVFNIILPVT